MVELAVLKAASQCLAISMQEAEEVRLGMAKAEVALRGIGSKLSALRSHMVPLQSASQAHEQLSSRTQAAVELTLALHKSLLQLRCGLREIQRIGAAQRDEDQHHHYVEAVAQVGEMLAFLASNLQRLQEEPLKQDFGDGARRRLMRLNKDGLHLMRLAVSTLEAQFQVLLLQQQAAADKNGNRRRIRRLKAIVDAIGTDRCRAAFVELRSRHCLGMSSSSACWSQDMEVAVELYTNERQLCKELFGQGDVDHTDESTAMVAQASMSQLVRRGNQIVTYGQLEELLDMFQALCRVTPLFSGHGPKCSQLRVRVRELHKLTVVAACRAFGHLDDKLLALQQQQHPPRDAGVMQSLTGHAIDYLELLLRKHGQALEQVLHIEHGWSSAGPKPPSLQNEMKRLVTCLVRAVVEQSRRYDEGDTVRRRIFVMNNHWYIVKRVTSSCELGSMLGDSWIKEQKLSLKQQALEYHKEAWGALLEQLSIATRLDGGRLFLGELFVRQRIDALSMALDQARRAHEQVVISDPELCTATRAALARSIVPAYRTYLQSYANLLGPACKALPAQRLEHLLLHHMFDAASSCRQCS